MRPNCSYESCISRAGKNGFCLKHRDIGEAVQALILLSNDGQKQICRYTGVLGNVRKSVRREKLFQGRKPDLETGVEKSSGKNKVSRKKR